MFKLCKSKNGYSKSEAELLVKETKLYRRDLINSGIRLPLNFVIRAVKMKNNRWNIVIIDEYLSNGEDLQKVFTNKSVSNERKKKMALSLIKLLLGLPDGTTRYPIAVLIDFTPENFVISDNNLVLVDYFCPKRWRNNTCYPYSKNISPVATQEILAFLCGDRRGTLARLIHLLKMDIPELFDEISESALFMINKMFPEASPFIRSEIKNDFSTIEKIYKRNILNPNLINRNNCF